MLYHLFRDITRGLVHLAAWTLNGIVRLVRRMNRAPWRLTKRYILAPLGRLSVLALRALWTLTKAAAAAAVVAVAGLAAVIGARASRGGLTRQASAEVSAGTPTRAELTPQEPTNEMLAAASSQQPSATLLHGQAPTQAPGAWHPDPAHRHELRYWDGQRWTEHVSDHGRTSSDPV